MTEHSTLSLDRGSGAEASRETPAPLLFVVLAAARPLVLPARHNLAQVDEVVIGRGDRREFRRVLDGGKRQLVLKLPDRSMSTDHARIACGPASAVLEDLQSKNGSLLNGRPTRQAVLADGDLVELGQTFFVYRSSYGVTSSDPDDLQSVPHPISPGLATVLPGLSRELERFEVLSRASLPLILQGPTGTGKEMLARAAHVVSQRKGRFVAVNCAALPDTLLEGELFGHRRGAFTNAVSSREGLVAAADGGTLFLDEVAELSPKAQAALLRVIQEQEVIPLGGDQARELDLRFVVATHRDLPELVAARSFREDLYARLAGHSFALPPLLRRREDLGWLVANLLTRILGADGALETIALDVRAARALLLHTWPRNVRELEQALGSALALSDDATIHLHQLPETVRKADNPPWIFSGALSPAAKKKAPTPEDERRRRQIIELLRAHQGNVTRVAEGMGKKRQQVQKWCRKLGVDPASFRKP